MANQFIPSKESQKLLLDFVKRIAAEHNSNQEYFTKMEAIDIAYARYVSNIDPNTGVVREEGIDAATTPVGVLNMPSTTPPVVVSQVDSMVAYLGDVFLSGMPLFPVVSSPKNKEAAEQLETLIDDHSRLGGYPRQLLLFLRDGIKYNFSALEADWTSIEQYTSMDNYTEIGQRKLNRDNKSYTKLRRLDPYNTIWDRTVAPGDVACEGDYAGYVELLSRPKMKRLLNRLSNDGKVFNTREALEEGYIGSSSDSLYHIHPQVSNYVAARKPESGLNWYAYLTGRDDSVPSLYVENYELLTLYVRIIPADFRLNVPQPKTPQIWKLRIVNQNLIIQAERIISAYDYLPVLFGQPLEDGLGYQTQSIAESGIPFQEAAKTLFNIRFNAARRAVADRALYDPKIISPHDVNSPVPAAKIPVRTNQMVPGTTLDAYYKQIPFDARGTETTVQDGMTIINFSKEMNGLNNPIQGQFQKGNKSVQEWNDVMGNADARLRLPALVLEYQVFVPLKEILKLNIFQYGDDAEIVSQKDGSVVTIKIDELRTKVLAFRLGDGYTPKSKLASTDSLLQSMQLIGQSQILQQQFGGMLPGMFVHLMQLLGVRGLEEYAPNQQVAMQNLALAQQLQNPLPPVGAPDANQPVPQ
jgi:hypothetical protein